MNSSEEEEAIPFTNQEEKVDKGHIKPNSKGISNMYYSKPTTSRISTKTIVT
jgi:hypothetical protein